MINKQKYNGTHSFIFPLFLSYFDINANELNSNISQLSYGVFLLSLIALLCFINIVGYVLSYYLIQQTKYFDENKYPRVSRIIKKYIQVNFIFIIIEILLCTTCLLLLVFFSLLYIYSGSIH
jgi:putative copper export protein